MTYNIFVNNKKYYVYITTNVSKTTLYTGITNNLAIRLKAHYDTKGNKNTFAGRYYCFYLIHSEIFTDINEALAREKEIKRWRREKKMNLIESNNPEWKFLNDNIM